MLDQLFMFFHRAEQAPAASLCHLIHSCADSICADSIFVYDACDACKTFERVRIYTHTHSYTHIHVVYI